MSELVVPKDGTEVTEAGQLKRLQVERHLTRYWYERKPEALKISEDLHPDIRQLISVCQMIVQCKKANELDAMRAGLNDLETLVSSWDTPDVVPV